MRPTVKRAASLGAALVAVSCTPDHAPSTDRPRGASAAIAAGPYTPGQSYFGQGGYIEYVAGNLPIIISAPHGGALTPADMPDRTCGITNNDGNTEQLARAIMDALHARTGKYPHVIINRLARRKLDANRDTTEATCGNPAARAPWHDWHDFIAVAKRAVVQQSGAGLYIDLHGNRKPIQRLELGYLLPPTDLAQTDATLDASTAYQTKSSIRTLSERSPLSFSALLRGPASLGSLYEARGYPAVPSRNQPNPGDTPYYWGEDGYNLQRHGCRAGGPICAIQLETNRDGVRGTAADRARFASTTATVLDLYLFAHYGTSLTPRRAARATSGSAAPDADTIIDQLGPRINNGRSLDPKPSTLDLLR